MRILAGVAVALCLGVAGDAFAQGRANEPRWREGEPAWIRLPEATPEQRAEYARLAGVDPTSPAVVSPGSSGKAVSDRPAVRAAIRTLGMELGRGALTQREVMILAVVVSGLNDCEY